MKQRDGSWTVHDEEKLIYEEYVQRKQINYHWILEVRKKEEEDGYNQLHG